MSDQNSAQEQKPKPFLRIIARGIVFLILVAFLLVSLPFLVISLSERMVVVPVAQLHDVQPSRPAIRDHITAELNARKGETRQQINAYLHALGGEEIFLRPHDFRFPDGSYNESVYWTIAYHRFPQMPISVRWTLVYDEDDRLIDVLLGSGL